MNVGKYQPGKLTGNGKIHLVDFGTDSVLARSRGEPDITLCSRAGHLKQVEPDGEWCQDCERRAEKIYGVEL